MVYRFLKIICKLVLKIYFRQVHVEGKDFFPSDGPFIVVANHPSSFMDPISIAVLVKQKIRFLAKGTLFKNRIVASLLKGLNMIPIYRAQDDPKMLSSNKDVFRSCYETLSKKGVIMIFPEGISEMERRLRKIKTGAARIALGAEKNNNYELGVRIVPVGLNYSKQSRFRSELMINIGKPIEVQDYVKAHQKNEVSAANQLTEDIESRIKELIIAIDEKEYEVLIERLECIYKTKLVNERTNAKNKNLEEVRISQRIVSAVKHYQESDSLLFERIKSKIDDYFEKLEETGISDKSISMEPHRDNLFSYILKSVFQLFVGFPFWVFGIIHSYIPYKLPRYVALAITKSEAFYGALLMSLGTLFFILFYSLATLVVWIISHSLAITAVYALLLPITGLLTIYYSRLARKFYFHWKLISKFYSKKLLVTELIEERKSIIAELEEIRIKFNTLSL